MLIHRKNLILASGSRIRQSLLRNVGLEIEALPAGIDESAVKLRMKGQPADQLARHLAYEKAAEIGQTHPDSIVIGCDQILDFNGEIFSKPDRKSTALQQISRLSGQTHHLISSVVLVENGRETWHHTARVQLTMRPLSPAYIDSYVTRNWPGIRDSVGSYKLEEEGARLFTEINGDYFTVLGLPLLPLLSHLANRGLIET